MNITLPSNSSEEYYPNNTLTTYRTHLATPIQVEIEHEVALSEIAVPTEWSCVTKYDKIILVILRSLYSNAEANYQRTNNLKTSDVDWTYIPEALTTYEPDAYDGGRPRGLDESKIGPDEIQHLDIPAVIKSVNAYDKIHPSESKDGKPLLFFDMDASVFSLAFRMQQTITKQVHYPLEYPGLYKDNAAFVEDLNDLMLADVEPKDNNFLTEAFRKDPARNKIIRYIASSGRTIIKPPRHCVLRLTANLAHILGFEQQTAFFAETKSPVSMDVFGDIHSLYVYSDIIETRAVADKMAQLLRVVSVDRTRKGGSVETVSFRNLQYFPMRTSSVGDILVYLRDRAGRPIPFLRGEVTVSLLLRPKE